MKLDAVKKSRGSMVIVLEPQSTVLNPNLTFCDLGVFLG
jgi:hypothetical protein